MRAGLGRVLCVATVGSWVMLGCVPGGDDDDSGGSSSSSSSSGAGSSSGPGSSSSVETRSTSAVVVVSSSSSVETSSTSAVVVVSSSSQVSSSGSGEASSASSAGLSSSSSADSSSSAPYVPGRCDAPKPLALGRTFGNTVGGGLVSAGMCRDLGTGAVDVFHYTAASDGELVLWVTTDTRQALLVRPSCDGVERTCAGAARSGFSPVVEVPDLHAGDTLVVLVAAESPGQEGPFELHAAVRSTRTSGQTCDVMGLVNRCAAGLRCSGPSPEGSTCQDATALREQACATAIPMVGGQATGDTSMAVDAVDLPCSSVPGTGDLVFSYQVQGIHGHPVDVAFILSSPTDQGLEVLHGCSSAASVGACSEQHGSAVQEYAVARDEAPGTTLLVVVSATSVPQQGQFMLMAQEVERLPLNSPCMPGGGSPESCGRGLSCTAGTCQAGHAPVLTEAILAARTDRPGLTLVISGEDVDGDAQAVEATAVDADGHPVPLLVRDWEGRLQTLPATETIPTGSLPTAFTGWEVALTAGRAQNRDQVVAVNVRLRDRTDLTSALYRAELTPMVPRQLGESCGTTLAEQCLPELTCDSNSSTCLARVHPECAHLVYLASGETLQVDASTATDVLQSSCDMPGTVDVTLVYTVQAAEADVDIGVKASGSMAISFRDACGSAAPELACFATMGGMQARAESVAQGEQLVMVLSGEPDAFAATFVDLAERPLPGAGEACAGRCRRGLLCRDAEGPAVCVVPQPPVLLEAALRAMDTDGDGTLDRLEARVSGTDADGEAQFLRVQFKDASGAPRDLWSRHGEDFGSVVSNQGNLLTGPLNLPAAQTAFTRVSVELSVGTVFNLADVRSGDVVLEDLGGRASNVLRDLPVTVVEVVGSNAPCDPLEETSLCAVGLVCAPLASGSHVCRDPAAYLTQMCADAPVLQLGVAQAGTTAGMPNVGRSMCTMDGEGRDRVYRYTMEREGVDLVLALNSATAQLVGVSVGCPGMAEVGCGSSSAGAIVKAPVGTQLYFWVEAKDESQAGPFTLTLAERQVVAEGGACDPHGVLNECTPGLLCFEQDAGPVCVSLASLWAPACTAAQPYPAAGVTGTSDPDANTLPVDRCGIGALPGQFYTFTTGDAVADVVAEVVGAEAGVPPGYFPELRRVCTDAGSAACPVPDPAGLTTKLQDLPAHTSVTVVLGNWGAPPLPFSLTVRQVLVRAAGQSCDPTGVQSRCQPGLLCNASGVCVDPEATWRQACQEAAPLTSGVDVTVSLADKPELVQVPCAVGGPDAVYRYTVVAPVADVRVDVSGPEGWTGQAAVLNGCAYDRQALSCGGMVQDLTQGTTLVVVVSGAGPDPATLRVTEYPPLAENTACALDGSMGRCAAGLYCGPSGGDFACIRAVCGNSVVEPGEECDVGPAGGPGCTATCLRVPLPEVEPNDKCTATPGCTYDYPRDSPDRTVYWNANFYTAMITSSVAYLGHINPANDEDNYAVQNPSGTAPMTLEVTTRDASNTGSCTGLDTIINQFDWVTMTVFNEPGGCETIRTVLSPGELRNYLVMFPPGESGDYIISFMVY